MFGVGMSWPSLAPALGCCIEARWYWLWTGGRLDGNVTVRYGKSPCLTLFNR